MSGGEHCVSAELGLAHGPWTGGSEKHVDAGRALPADRDAGRDKAQLVAGVRRDRGRDHPVEPVRGRCRRAPRPRAARW